MNISYIFYAVLIGIIPALLWLWFWLQEDDNDPEPRSIIAMSFVAGMLAAPIALLFEIGAKQLIPNATFTFFGSSINYYIILWVIIEEVLKFGASYFALRSSADDEPVDAMIYLITAAIGFVAIENSLFILSVLTDPQHGGLVAGFADAVSRFVGPSLLHIVTSGIIGLSVSLSFYLHGLRKNVYMLLGLCTAITLHTFYNFFIIVHVGSFTTVVFTSVWVLAVALMLAFEIVKRIKQ